MRQICVNNKKAKSFSGVLRHPVRACYARIMDYKVDTASGRLWHVPPHMRAYAKVDRRDNNKLLLDIHHGFIRYFLARGIKPPSVSTTIIEDPDTFLDYAQRHL